MNTKAKTIKITRLYAAQGKSHFGELELATETGEFAPPSPPLNSSAWFPAEQCRFMLQPPGWVGDWHCPPARLLFCVLAGEAWIEVSNGERRQFTAGESFIAEDKPGQGHRSGVVGKVDLLTAVIQLPDNALLK